MATRSPHHAAHIGYYGNRGKYGGGNGPINIYGYRSPHRVAHNDYYGNIMGNMGREMGP
jgi:hypothetical protein